MEPSFKVQRSAFRVDVCGHRSNVHTDQAPAAEMERQLQQLLRPASGHLRTQAAAAAKVCASAIDAEIRGQPASAEAVQARQRRTRWRVNSAPEAEEMPAPTEASLMFSKGNWAEEAAPGIVRAGMGVVCSSLRSERRISVRLTGDVIDGTMPFEIGAGSSSVLSVAVCVASKVEAPYSSGVVGTMVAAMNRHAQRHPDVRYAWAIIVGPGCIRVCLMEPDALHLSAVQSTTAPTGCHLLGAAMAHAAFSEPWRLGADPTMQWRQDIGRWAIKCPAAGRKSAQTFYAPREPMFITQSFFGRFTRCFAIARTPDDNDFCYILKDSWQLVATHLDDPDLHDEIRMLRDIQEALDKVECKGGVLQHLVCGGTVAVNATRDSTELVLGTELDKYMRWTAIHGAKPTTLTHRLHRRMVSGPIGIPLHKIHNDRDAAATVAGAMSVHDTIMRHAKILHRDISFGNVLAVRQADGTVRGMLIDFDNSVAPNEKRNQKHPGRVGTMPFMSIANLEGIDVARTSLDDWEAALTLLMCWAARPSRRDKLFAELGCLEPDGSAHFRRGAFSSRKSLDHIIDAYLDSACEHTLKLIRDLHEALFAYPGCSGTWRDTLLDSRRGDPIVCRVDFANAIHERCIKVVTEYLAEYLTKSESEPTPTLMALPKLQPPSDGLHRKRKLEEYAETTSLRVKRRNMAHDDAWHVSFSTAYSNNPPPLNGSPGEWRVYFSTAYSDNSPDPAADAQNIIGDAPSPATNTAPPNDSYDEWLVAFTSAYTSDAPDASHGTPTSAPPDNSPDEWHVSFTSAYSSDSPLKRRESSRDEPPDVPSPKRRKRF
ncbi:hypothetical protein H4S07_000292 [Coemansia furcata]|uniref:Uncharacterized protein n=1 Tax=Coemansia furcata TaxID=417177 RepID=A0ACC1LQN9_9FUNG|nr:hypothetical protein H4S07_000292 [Coemansia furcata]